MEEFEGRSRVLTTDGGMVRPSQQDVAPYQKGLSEERIGHERFENSGSGLRIVAVF